MKELPVSLNVYGVALPTLIAGAGEPAARRFLEFFTVNIRNKNTLPDDCLHIGQGRRNPEKIYAKRLQAPGTTR
jgi:hypothetical protein